MTVGDHALLHGSRRLVVFGSAAVLGLGTTAVGFAAGRPGTRLDSYKLGSVVRLGDVAVSVQSVNRHAWPALKSLSASNRPPLPGTTYVLVTIRALNQGRAEAIPFVDGTLDAVTRSNRLYSAFNAPCGKIATDVSNISPIQPHTARVVHVCWEVESVEASSLLMAYEPYTNASPVYFALR